MRFKITIIIANNHQSNVIRGLIILVKEKKPFYKKWWVWLIAVVIIIAIATGGEDDEEETSESVTDDVVDEQKEDGDADVDTQLDEEQEDLDQLDQDADIDKEEVEKKEINLDEEIEKIVENIVKNDLNSTEINKIGVNENMGLEDGSYIVLPHLKWNVKNKEKTTREMLEMYSDHLAAKLADESDISEITVFWEVPYHKEGDNIAKFMYERSGNGMAKTDNWYDSVSR